MILQYSRVRERFSSFPHNAKTWEDIGHGNTMVMSNGRAQRITDVQIDTICPQNTSSLSLYAIQWVSKPRTTRRAFKR
jgi:hypothetical protein